MQMEVAAASSTLFPRPPYPYPLPNSPAYPAIFPTASAICSISRLGPSSMFCVNHTPSSHNRSFSGHRFRFSHSPIRDLEYTTPNPRDLNVFMINASLFNGVYPPPAPIPSADNACKNLPLPNPPNRSFSYLNMYK